MIFKSTKIYRNLPCSHQQYKSADESGIAGTGICAQTHGYSREFHFEFECESVDDYGWVIDFGSLSPLKNWLNFMFDHTSLWEPSDPRINDVIAQNETSPIKIFNLRILPFGVSMEQTSLFVSIIVNHYIMNVTNGRCWISKLEVRENDKNSGILELTKDNAISMIQYHNDNYGTESFPRHETYKYVPPLEIIKKLS